MASPSDCQGWPGFQHGASALLVKPSCGPINEGSDFNRNQPDGAEELETLGILADSDLGHEHLMYRAVRGLGLNNTQLLALGKFIRQHAKVVGHSFCAKVVSPSFCAKVVGPSFCANLFSMIEISTWRTKPGNLYKHLKGPTLWEGPKYCYVPYGKVNCLLRSICA